MIRRVNIDSNHLRNMSWNNVHKLRPQKPKSESEQNLGASTEFLVWDTEFNLNNSSDEHPDTLSQDILSDDTALSQSSDTPENMSNKPHPVVLIPPKTPENPENKDLILKTVFGYDFLGDVVPIDCYWVFMDKPTNTDKESDQSCVEVLGEFTTKIATSILGVDPECHLSPSRKRQTGGIISARNFPQRT